MLKEAYDYVVKFFKDPRATIQPFLDKIAEKLNAEVPGRARNLGLQNLQENNLGGASQDADNGSVQRANDDVEEDRTTASVAEVIEGIIFYVTETWNEVNGHLGELLWQTFRSTFWPPATIEAIGNLFSELWNDHWATTVNSLYAPRNFLDHPLLCLHDIWSNFLILLDFPLSLVRTLTSVVALLMGYVTIIVVLVEGILGGIAGSAAGGIGAIPGFFAGAAAGLATMAPIGEALTLVYLVVEGLTVQTILLRLFTARQTCEKRQVDIMTAVSSYITMAVALVIQLLMALLARLVDLIAGLIKGIRNPAPQPTPPAPGPTPPAPGPTPPAPGPTPPAPGPTPPAPGPTPPAPGPTPPAPGPTPPAPGPTPPAPGPTPPAPGPTPPAPPPPAPAPPPPAPAPPAPAPPPARPPRTRPRPRPPQPQPQLQLQSNLQLQTLREATKSKEGVNHGSNSKDQQQDGQLTNKHIILSNENGTIQTLRRDNINPDACQTEKCDVDYKWWRKGTSTSAKFRLIYCKKNVNFLKHEHHSWPKFLGGPDKKQDPLLPVAERIHSTEFHGNSGPIGPVHKAVENVFE